MSISADEVLAPTTEFSGTADIGNEGIKKHFKKSEAYEPLFELVWNGFDAKAERVYVKVYENDLNGIDCATVLDDGLGIDYTTLKTTFGQFNESSKQADPSLHGSHGRGRLAFHVICRDATWFTRSTKGDARISVEAQSIKHYKGHHIKADEQHPKLADKPHGTVVELRNFTKSLPSSETLRERFSAEFGWFLAVRDSMELRVNDMLISVPRHEITKRTINVRDHDFEVQVIRWDNKPSSEKSYIYLFNSKNELVFKVLSTLNNKPGFFTTVCVTSAWADSFSPTADLLNLEANSLTSLAWRGLIRQLNALTEEVYEDFLRKKAETVVDGYIRDGYFPTYAGLSESEREWRLNNSRTLVKEIYLVDPQVFNASKKQIRVIIRLIDRLAISNENDALLDVLNGALDLSPEAVQKLSGQLRQTSFENIISTIEILQRRATAVQKLRVVMNEHYREVLETPDLQQIIENNTWLFGPKFETLGAEEDTFTKIAKSLRDKAVKNHEIDEADVEVSNDVAGAQRQVDLFLARKYPTNDSRGQSIYKCTIIEIKRPSIALNTKHLRQLEDYAQIIKRFPEFSSERTHFELILIGRKISSDDTLIQGRKNDLIDRGEMGLIAELPRMKLYVMDWYTLLDTFDLSNDFMLERLKLRRAELAGQSKEKLITELQQPH